MTQNNIKIKCIDCTNTIYQTIDNTSLENHIYCPKCHNIFPYDESMRIPEDANSTQKSKMIIPQTNQEFKSKIDELTKLLDDKRVLDEFKNRNINPKDIMNIISNANQLTSDLIEQNLQKAIDEIPHTLFRSESIFLNGYINGNPISFLLDTGAESSVLPFDIVEASGLHDILDRKCSGKLVGVGEDKILGRIHYVEVVLDCGVYPCSFVVCSNPNMLPILGIDMMFNLGISLDFKKRKIIFDSNYSVDFVTKTGAMNERKKKMETTKFEIPKNPKDSIEEMVKKIISPNEIIL
jgi:predicted aspartyl protease